VQSVAENPRESSSGLLPGTEMSSLSMGTAPTKTPDETFEATGRGESVGEPEETRPASVWWVSLIVCPSSNNCQILHVS